MLAQPIKRVVKSPHTILLCSITCGLAEIHPPYQLWVSAYSLAVPLVGLSMIALTQALPRSAEDPQQHW